MENLETVLEEIEKYERNDFKEDLSTILVDYMKFIAKTGDPIFPWHRIKSLLRHKLSSVMGDFFEAYGGEETLETSNTPSFAYTPTKTKILQHFDSFIGAPFTIQRLCEILMAPMKHYKRTDKFLRGIEKTILVVSIVEPGSHVKRNLEEQLVNGMQETIESEEMREDMFNGSVTSNGVSGEDTSSSSSSSSCSSSASSSPTPDEDPHECGPTPKRPRLDSPIKETFQQDLNNDILKTVDDSNSEEVTIPSFQTEMDTAQDSDAHSGSLQEDEVKKSLPEDSDSNTSVQTCLSQDTIIDTKVEHDTIPKQKEMKFDKGELEVDDNSTCETKSEKILNKASTKISDSSIFNKSETSFVSLASESKMNAEDNKKSINYSIDQHVNKDSTLASDDIPMNSEEPKLIDQIPTSEHPNQKVKDEIITDKDDTVVNLDKSTLNEEKAVIDETVSTRDKDEPIIEKNEQSIDNNESEIDTPELTINKDEQQTIEKDNPTIDISKQAIEKPKLSINEDHQKSYKDNEITNEVEPTVTKTERLNTEDESTTTTNQSSANFSEKDSFIEEFPVKDEKSEAAIDSNNTKSDFPISPTKVLKDEPHILDETS